MRFAIPIFRVFTGIILLLSCNSRPPESVNLPPQSLSQNVGLIEDEIAGQKIVIAGSGGMDLFVAFERITHDGTELTFSPIQNKLPLILSDQEGNEWDIFGKAQSGPRTGESLLPANLMMGYWFAWGTFFPGIDVYNEPPHTPLYDPKPPSDDWSVSRENVFGVTGQDDIPALENPPHIRFKERNFLDDSFFLRDEDLVLIVRVNDQIRAYPHPILDWHEIINDTLGGEAISVIYCPLTGTGNAVSRMINGTETTFGVSGLLYDNNIVPYDRQTESLWSQIRGDCIHGDLIEQTFPQNYPVIETTWKTWKLIMGAPMVVSDDTGVDRIYTEYPYGSYKTNGFIGFPLTYKDDRLHPKTRVIGIRAGDQAKVYKPEDF